MNRLKNDYRKILDWLDFLNEGKIVPGLERIKELMNNLGNPQEKLEIVMIGGTNAKGSTCFSLNSTLNKAGIKSGCFTSTHLHSVRERIRIGEQIISIKKFTSILSKIKNISEDIDVKPTYFEALTAAAYQYFHSEDVDYALMEIGLGGEWDAVNIGQAKIAILTTLGLDHQDYLGNKIEQIGETKAKIVNDERIDIEIAEGIAREASSISAINTPQFNLLVTTIRQVFPKTIVVPGLSPGGTDSKHFQGLTSNIYRFIPFDRYQGRIKGVHGTNEKLSIKSLRDGVTFYVQLIKNTGN